MTNYDITFVPRITDLDTTSSDLWKLDLSSIWQLDPLPTKETDFVSNCTHESIEVGATLRCPSADVPVGVFGSVPLHVEPDDLTKRGPASVVTQSHQQSAADGRRCIRYDRCVDTKAGVPLDCVRNRVRVKTVKTKKGSTDSIIVDECNSITTVENKTCGTTKVRICGMIRNNFPFVSKNSEKERQFLLADEPYEHEGLHDTPSLDDMTYLMADTRVIPDAFRFCRVLKCRNSPHYHPNHSHNYINRHTSRNIRFMESISSCSENCDNHYHKAHNCLNTVTCYKCNPHFITHKSIKKFRKKKNSGKGFSSDVAGDGPDFTQCPGSCSTLDHYHRLRGNRSGQNRSAAARRLANAAVRHVCFYLCPTSTPVCTLRHHSHILSGPTAIFGRIVDTEEALQAGLPVMIDDPEILVESLLPDSSVQQDISDEVNDNESVGSDTETVDYDLNPPPLVHHQQDETQHSHSQPENVNPTEIIIPQAIDGIPPQTYLDVLHLIPEADDNLEAHRRRYLGAVIYFFMRYGGPEDFREARQTFIATSQQSSAPPFGTLDNLNRFIFSRRLGPILTIADLRRREAIPQPNEAASNMLHFIGPIIADNPVRNLIVSNVQEALRIPSYAELHPINPQGDAAPIQQQLIIPPDASASLHQPIIIPPDVAASVQQPPIQPPNLSQQSHSQNRRFSHVVDLVVPSGDRPCVPAIHADNAQAVADFAEPGADRRGGGAIPQNPIVEVVPEICDVLDYTILSPNVQLTLAQRTLEIDLPMRSITYKNEDRISNRRTCDGCMYDWGLFSCWPVEDYVHTPPMVSNRDAYSMLLHDSAVGVDVIFGQLDNFLSHLKYSHTKRCTVYPLLAKFLVIKLSATTSLDNWNVPGYIYSQCHSNARLLNPFYQSYGVNLDTLASSIDLAIVVAMHTRWSHEEVNGISASRIADFR